ncbi:hypodermin-B [Drosophila takahashii]|uniref:hypodermin-B n=1 Tax=Drosophila takahashii TaxID=29030 RepID=UPI001CF8D4A6|nr:hypodermin-B [Drosophila takahashii]
MFLWRCMVLILFSRSSNGIHNGVDARFDFWNFIVAIRINGYQECGGSVIDSQIVITAAQCVKGIALNKITVRAGSSEPYRGGKVFKVTAVVVHEKYKAHELNDDIALLWLSSSVLSSRVTKIPLTQIEPAENEYPSNAGWGEKQLESYVLPKKLQNGVTKLRPRSVCVEELLDPTGPELLCSFYIQNDICPGDYGGPLILANKLVGIAVQGHGCGYTELPSLYTNVFHYLRWIEENSKKLKKNK